MMRIDEFTYLHWCGSGDGCGSGVYTAAEGCDSAGAAGTLTHAMVVVGFNADGDANGVPYWIVRNSWCEVWAMGCE